MKENDYISRKQTIERLKLNFPISQGADNSRDRHRYMQAMADIQAIREMPSVAPQEPQTFKWCTTCKEYDQNEHCCHRWSKVIRDTVEEMKQEPRWIPVSEYLPVTNDEVLVTYIVNGNAKKRYVETANCFDGEWSSVNDEYRIPNTKIEIIAWCEMPKPYKGESEG